MSTAIPRPVPYAPIGQYPATFLARQNPISVVGADIFPTVLWAPAFTVPSELGKTPYMPLGINSVVGASIYRTR